MSKFTPRGSLLISTLIFGAVAVILLNALASSGAINLRASRDFTARERAFQIAEAGVEYYRWHLAHDQEDFTDGTGGPGPYLHDFLDKDGNPVGAFSLTITPPPVGSTLVTVASEGWTLARPDLRRTIEARLSIPSLAQYAVAANNHMRFGEGTEIFGPVHSNNGIRFDGLIHNLITSAVGAYDDPDHSGDNEYGVHTHVRPPPQSGVSDSALSSETPPPDNNPPPRPDVFEVGRQFPVPAIDFNGFASNLAEIKNAATSSGLYLPPSGQYGYNLVLQTDDRLRLYRVKSLQNPPSGCNQPTDSHGNPTQPGWGSWSINPEPNDTYQNGQDRLDQNLQVVSYTCTSASCYLPFPANGLIFVEDNVWVEGQIDGARLTIASARFPETSSTNSSITINHDLRYTHEDGQDVVGLISQGNVNIGMKSDSDLEIDAALVSKNGRVGRYYYRPNSKWPDDSWKNWPNGASSSRCAPYDYRSIITLYGMIASNQRYGFSWVCPSPYYPYPSIFCSGYQDRIITYDGNLLYSPPPSFPLTGDQYQVLSWREL